MDDFLCLSIGNEMRIRDINYGDLLGDGGFAVTRYGSRARICFSLTGHSFHKRGLLKLYGGPRHAFLRSPHACKRHRTKWIEQANRPFYSSLCG